jgi:hypothetical protein
VAAELARGGVELAEPAVFRAVEALSGRFHGSPRYPRA